jgi:pilus assembly protein CpaE
MAQRILAVDDNPINLRLITAMLLNMGFEVFTAENGPEALSRLPMVKPDLIVLDVMMPEMDGYEVCRRIRANANTSQIPVIMLTAHDSLEEKVKGFESGADDYLSKPAQEPELEARIKVLLRRRGTLALTALPPERTGRTISVFSLRGGVGVSSIAANLSIGLAQLWNLPVALVDLAFPIGQSALLMNMPLRNTWADLVGIEIADLDYEVLKRVLMHHASGVDLLSTARLPEQSELIGEDRAAQVFKLLRHSYDYMVIDLAHDFSPITLAALDISDEIITVMTPELASLRAMMGTYEAFEKVGIDRGRVTLAINWIFAKRGLARKDIETTLKQPVEWVMPFLPEVFVSAINLGTPPALNEPESTAGVLFDDLAYSVSQEEHSKNRPLAPSEAWNRLTTRQQKNR